MRHDSITLENDPKRGESIATHSRDYKRGSRIPAHCHGSDQLIYAVKGVMEIALDATVWILPPQFGLWMPARIIHEIRMPEAVSFRTLYFHPGLVRRWPACRVFQVSPLVRELILEIVRTGRIRNNQKNERVLRDLLLAHLEKASPMPTAISFPRDHRARAVAETLLNDPALKRPLSSMCSAHGISVRTFQRVFLRETGLDFTAWRRQLRLLKAIELLVSGRSVKESAFMVGYQETSPFISLFRSTFGTTPKVWVSSVMESFGYSAWTSDGPWAANSKSPHSSIAERGAKG